MPLLQDICTKVAAIGSLFHLSPLHQIHQAPFQVPSRIAPEIQQGPIFHPPGAPRDSDFKCEYPEMKGWEDCSTSLNRKCWLRNPSTGEQYDMNTDYETFSPKGINRYYNLTLTDDIFDADGLNFTLAKLFELTGGTDTEYPGPWIQACWGDTIIVNVTNNLIYNGTSVHWHGIRQWKTMHMDGVNGVTQCPIAPGDHFVFKFAALQYGSSWYHSHYSVQYADGAAGGMTLHGPHSADYDEAISPPLIMTDWSHDTAFLAVEGSGLVNETVLLNGRGNITRFKNSDVPLNTTTIQNAYSITFEGPKPGRSNKRYLLRVINTSFQSTFVFSIDNHTLEVVSADFVPIQPYKTSTVVVGIGQRYNVIVEANPLGPLEEAGNYWIRTQMPHDCEGGDAGQDGYDRIGILRYNNASTINPTSKPWEKVTAAECRDEPMVDLHPIVHWEVPPIQDGQEERKKNSTYKGASIFTPLRVNYSNPTILNLDNKGAWPPLSNIIELNGTDEDWIYLAIKGNGTKGHTFGAHPIHLHGHDFAILAQVYDQPFNSSALNLTYHNPPRRDVVLLPSNGYIVIAFKSDNPGAWLVHCHIAFHISAGLGLQIMEDQGEANKIWPKGDSKALDEADRVCGNWKAWYNQTSNWAVKPWDAPCQTQSIKDHPDWCFQEDSGV